MLVAADEQNHMNQHFLVPKSDLLNLIMVNSKILPGEKRNGFHIKKENNLPFALRVRGRLLQFNELESEDLKKPK